MSDDSFKYVENSTPLPQTAHLIEELRTLVPDAENLHKYVEKVKEDYQQKMNDDVENLNNLLEAFTAVLKERTSQKQKDKGWIWKRAPWPAKPKVKVFSVVAAKTFGADTQILSKVEAEVCSSPEHCDVVVVFCPVTSRVGSDVDDAMREIPESARRKNVILVVMHHSRKDISSSETQLNHGHENVIQDVHVVYHETIKGLIKCDRNDKAIQTLKDLCKTSTA